MPAYQFGPKLSKDANKHTQSLINHPLIHRLLVNIIQLQLLEIFWPYFGELATEKNACVCFARMSFVTPHIFLGLASFHFLVISDRFISKQRSGIPSTLGEICTTHNIHTYMRECRQRMQLAIMEALASEVIHKWRHYFLFTFLTPPYPMSPTFLLKHGYFMCMVVIICKIIVKPA